MEVNKESVTDTPFNMAMLYYMELHEIRKAKSRAIIDNNLPVYLECLEELFSNVSFKLSKIEIQEVKNLFNEVHNKLELPNNREGRKMLQFAYSDAKKLLRDIDMKITKLMDKYKMIFPNLKIRDGVKDIRTRYGLKEDKKDDNNKS